MFSIQLVLIILQELLTSACATGIRILKNRQKKEGEEENEEVKEEEERRGEVEEEERGYSLTEEKDTACINASTRVQLLKWESVIDSFLSGRSHLKNSFDYSGDGNGISKHYQTGAVQNENKPGLRDHLQADTVTARIQQAIHLSQ